MRLAIHVARMGDMRNAYELLVWESEGTRPLERFSSRWEDNIKLDIREVGWEAVDWIYSAHGRDQVAGSCEHGIGLPNSIKGRGFLISW